jgi:DNA-binding transcriptional MerR regulator
MPTTKARSLTLGRLARATGLARASLLNYESLGLLEPSARSASGYRLYDAAAIERLQSIRRFRDAGMSLKAIRTLLSPTVSSESAQLLEARMLDVCNEIERLRTQQQQLARLLAAPRLRNGRFEGGKNAWVALLRRAGMSEAEMHEWHRTFEADAPREHAAFLRSLGLDAKEIARIRRWSNHKKETKKN